MERLSDAEIGSLASLDWWVVGLYLAGMLSLAVVLGRRQTSARDYYLGGGSLPAPALATSILATQCSTNSLLGAPAFVGFSSAGGLIWLQYELAVPLAMLALAALFPPIYRSRPISVYAFLEERLGRRARRLASGAFLFFRGVATGITVYGVASILGLITGISYTASVALLMGVTVAYDVLGGMRAVVISDVLQMVLLLAAVSLALYALFPYLIDFGDALNSRSRPLTNDWGLSGNSDFGFWPMLFGGLFLYTAYYGFDQSQAQRLLAARDPKALQQILILNGLLRFPIVLAYCLLGLGLAAYALANPAFIDTLPKTAAGAPNINLVFPQFVLADFPAGLAGLAIVGLFAAAMSSIDSALNSLSASTLEDYFPAAGGAQGPRRFFLSKVVTLLWGLFAIGFSFTVEVIADTVLEAINKVGSLVNGPLLALFLLALTARSRRESHALGAFVIGLSTNLIIWLGFPSVSWLWWNVTGCAATLGAYAMADLNDGRGLRAPAAVDWTALPRSSASVLGAAALGILLLLLIIQWKVPT